MGEQGFESEKNQLNGGEDLQLIVLEKEAQSIEWTDFHELGNVETSSAIGEVVHVSTCEKGVLVNGESSGAKTKGIHVK